MVFIIMQNKKKRSQVIQKAVCLSGACGRRAGVGRGGWGGVGWGGPGRWHAVSTSFIPLLLYLSPCPLGKRADYFCWETDYMHLANTLLFLMTKCILGFSLILALRPAGWYEIHRPLHAQGRERPRLRSASDQVGLLLPCWVRPTHANTRFLKLSVMFMEYLEVVACYEGGSQFTGRIRGMNSHSNFDFQRCPDPLGKDDLWNKKLFRCHQ